MQSRKKNHDVQSHLLNIDTDFQTFNDSLIYLHSWPLNRIPSGFTQESFLTVDFVIAGVSRGSKMVCFVCIILKKTKLVVFPHTLLLKTYGHLTYWSEVRKSWTNHTPPWYYCVMDKTLGLRLRVSKPPTVSHTVANIWLGTWKHPVRHKKNNHPK